MTCKRYILTTALTTIRLAVLNKQEIEQGRAYAAFISACIQIILWL